MKWKKASLVLVGLLVCVRPAAAEEGCVSGPCHAALLKAKTVHPATESCEACHESVTTPHPLAGKKTFKLAQELPGLCSACHEPFGKTGPAHAPVQEGMCTTCHDPHASNEPKLLVQPLGQLCEACHSDHVSFEHVHGPVSAGDCTACHTPHESDTKPLLRKPADELCAGCHPNVADSKKKKDVHPPLLDGCTTCHNPHGSANAKLLVQSFPSRPYVPYTDTEFELCFSCHDRDLVRNPDTSIATGFRDGERNLHYLHVHDALKGRSCTLCHDVHGSDSPKLMAESVPFGQWKLPLRFVKTETGGGCAPGCHKPYSYDRQSPRNKPAPRQG
jgi:predicted CXXCH cytochrome family protein